MAKETKRRSETVALFSIESGSVGAAIFVTGADRPTVLFSCRVDIASKGPGAPALRRAMRVALDQAAARAHDSRMSGIGHIAVVLGSPWHVGQTRAIRYERQAPFPVTEKLMRDLATAEAERFGREVMPGEGSVIENYTIDAKLNGYPMPSPFGKKASLLELSAYFSIAPEALLEDIRGVLGRHFSLSARDVSFATNAFSSYRLLRDLFVHDDDFLLVSVEGEMTEVSLVTGGVLRETASMPQGSLALERAATAALRVTPAEARSLLRAAALGTLASPEAKRVEAALGPAVAAWRDGFHRIIERFGERLGIPSRVFLESDGDSAGRYQELVKAEEYGQYALTDRRFQVTLLGPEVAGSLCAFGEAGGDARAGCDYRLMVDIVHLNRIRFSHES